MADDVPDWIVPALREAMAYAEWEIDRDRQQILGVHDAVRTELLALERRVEELGSDELRWSVHRTMDALLTTCDEARDRVSRIYAAGALDRVRAVVTDLQQ